MFILSDELLNFTFVNNMLMKVQQLSLSQDNWSESLELINIDVNLFLLFVSPEFKFTKEVLNSLSKSYPNATIAGCSTAGEISDITVKDNSISLTAIHFQKTIVKKVSVKIDDMDHSYEAGQELGSQFDSKGLRHIIVLSDGLNVNGADLVSGLKSKLPKISITGGLAADGSDFNKTFVIDNDEISDKTIIGLGLYGEDLILLLCRLVKDE